MSWRDTLAESLGNPRPDADEPKSLRQPPMDKLDNMDTNTDHRNSVHTVHSVHRVKRTDLAPPAIPAATEADARELQAWPPETERVFVKVLNHIENQGYPLAEAEPLALATVRLLIKRRRGPVCLVSDLPPEVGRAVGLALDVFGACSTSWTPERREVL